MDLTHTRNIFRIAVFFVLLLIPLLWILSQENVAASIIEIQQNGRASLGEILNM